MAYCEGLTWGGDGDWRLPNKQEIFSIVDHRVDSPAIDTAIFPGTTEWVYWSSTTALMTPPWDQVWSMDIYEGQIFYYGYKDNDFYISHIHCVRDGT